MNSIEKISNIIRGRTCFVVAKGTSLNELDNRITMFRDLDVCWCSMNDFHYIENRILGQICKKFELISDCATVLNVEYYEKNIRIPRFEEYLKRPDKNLLMLSELVVQQCFRDTKRADFLHQYEEKIITIDSLFSLPTCPQEVWNKPPNSITLLYAFLIAGGAKKIINFGLDGTDKNSNLLPTYYMPEVVKQERIDAFGDNRDGSLKTDTASFNQQWGHLQHIYSQAFNNHNVQIYNCSPNSFIKVFQPLTYDQVRENI